MPHLNLPGSSFFCFNQKPDFNVIAGYDIIVVQRCCTAPQYEFLRTVQRLEQKIVYDIDDDVWDIPPFNPAHQILKQHREGFNACIQMVDVVSASTRTLARIVKNNVKVMRNQRTNKEIPIVVAENRIDPRMFIEPVKSDKLIVGWAGSSSHVGDLEIVQDAIINLAKENRQVRFEFRGLKPSEVFADLRNVSWKPWTPVAEFGARMPLWGWSIGLAPLTDHPFNESKSSIKMVESAYCGVPCLASWIKPYDDFVSHDRELRWLLCAGKANWEPKLRELINDQAKREELGRRAKAVVEQHYSLDRPHDGWRHVFETVRAC